MAKNIKTRAEDYAQWYLDVIKAAQLADYSPVRGCMVIRPEGFAVWEAIQRDLDRRFKETGHVNAYFPLLIPQGFLTKEAQHVEGFAMECAVVTHSKLEHGAHGLKPGGELEEPLIVRPTSETVIGHMYAQWVQSYRDLPVLINQWCNVMRWELRTRLFLRTAEFLWQEGHTAHETDKEAEEETLRMLEVYRAFAEDVLAIPVIKGLKTEAEKFPGAVRTYAIEGLMQDGKALQCGTSHNLGQNFAKAFDIKFLGRDNKIAHCWTTSWGVSTRLIGAMIMAHSDDDGLVLPPAVAQNLVAIVPIQKTDADINTIAMFVMKLLRKLVPDKEIIAGINRSKNAQNPAFAQIKIEGVAGENPQIQVQTEDESVSEADVQNLSAILSGKTSEVFSFVAHYWTQQRVVFDGRDMRPGDKHYFWEQHGVPFRIEVGPRDVEAGTFVLKRRFDRYKETVRLDDIGPDWLWSKLRETQKLMFEKARKFREENIRDASSLDEMKQILAEKGGFVRCFFKQDKSVEARIKEETKATVRCIPSETADKRGKCIVSGEEGQQVLFAVAY